MQKHSEKVAFYLWFNPNFNLMDLLEIISFVCLIIITANNLWAFIDKVNKSDGHQEDNPS